MVKARVAKEKVDVYQIVTDKIIEALEKGTIPWRKSWKSTNQLPANLITKKHYNGINVFLLGLAPYASPYYVSYKQAQELGGNVRKGEKGWMVVYWNFLEVEDKDNSDKTKKIPFLRYYTVFNVEQCEGLEGKVPQTDIIVRDDAQTIAECEKIVTGFKNKPPIHKENRCVYHPSDDTVGIPDIKSFDSSEEYYVSLFHELIHSTKHESRLNRKYSEEDNSNEKYSKEELVAEIGGTFLCAVAGIENKIIDNSAAYIQNWLERLQNDKRLIVSAAGAASKAANYILGDEVEGE